MPGETLVCVWEAAHSTAPNSNLTISLLKQVTSQFQDLPSVDYSEAKFQTALSNHKVLFSDYKLYAHTVLRKSNTPLLTFLEQIEQKCWNLCKSRYVSNCTSENIVEMVWQIFNRYADESSFPVTVQKGKAISFLNNLYEKVGIKVKEDKCFTDENVTFSALLKVLDDLIFSGKDKSKYEEVVSSLNKNVTKNIVKCGWVFHRSNKMLKWTGWRKRWCVFTPEKLLFYKKGDYTNPDGSSVKGEVSITSGPKSKSVEPSKTTFKKYLGCFKISYSNLNLQSEMEMSAGSERQFWMEAIREMTCSNSVNTVGESDANCSPQKVAIEIRETKKKEESSKPQDVVSLEEDKLKVMFMKIDKNGNGFIDEVELLEYFRCLGLSLPEADVKQVFQKIDKDGTGTILFDEFVRYFEVVSLQKDNENSLDNKVRSAFLSADLDGSGSINFKEFAECVWEKRRNVRMGKLLAAFSKMDPDGDGEVPYDKFRSCFEKDLKDLGISQEEDKKDKSDQTDNLNQMLKILYDDRDEEDLAVFINNRWKTFADFKRFGASGEIVMKGSHDMVADYTPGEYSLVDLACFSDVPPIVPKHTVVKGVKWVSSAEASKSGKCIFPAFFDGKIVLDNATNETLRYYECSFANGNEVKVSLLHRHGIQDFTYDNKYLDDYVKNENGGSGIERHQFSHLDCPFEDDSGYFILGKFHTDDELHLTAFRIPVRYTLYIPGGVIHSNDYLKGKWRTMLSDESHIDHVHLVQRKTNHAYKNFTFTFV